MGAHKERNLYIPTKPDEMKMSVLIKRVFEKIDSVEIMGKLFWHSFQAEEIVVLVLTVDVPWKKYDSLSEGWREILFRDGRNGEGGQGDAPLGLPPPLGERGGHPHTLFKM